MRRDRDILPVLEVNGAAKRFARRLSANLRYGLIDSLRDLSGLAPRSGLGQDEFWAFENVSFQLRRGECLGLLGANGAGKSTLLKMIAGLLKPDRGELRVRGRVGALIELGAGMHPLLSGRENIFVNAAVLGLRPNETRARLDEIIAFADLGDFIDTPVQYYSSGMRVRLGFSVAAHLDPDLLLIDEVLAVGDAAFRARCYERIDRLKDQCAIVFVSHHEQQISRLCDRTLFLSPAGVKTCDSPAEGLNALRAASPTGDSFSHSSGAAVSCNVEHDPSGSLVLQLTITGVLPAEGTLLAVTLLSTDGFPFASAMEQNPPTDRPFLRRMDLSTLNLGKVDISLLLLSTSGRQLFWHHRHSSLLLSPKALHLPSPIVVDLEPIPET